LEQALGGQCVTIFEWGGGFGNLAAADNQFYPVCLKLAHYQNDCLLIGKVASVSNDQVQELINRFVEPKLSAVKIDLNESRADIQKTVTEFLPKRMLPKSEKYSIL